MRNTSMLFYWGTLFFFSRSFVGFVLLRVIKKIGGAIWWKKSTQDEATEGKQIYAYDKIQRRESEERIQWRTRRTE